MWKLPSGPRIYLADGSGVYSIAWSPDERLVALGRESSTISLRNTTNFTGNFSGIYALEGHSDDVTSVAFSPNSRLLASGSLDCTCKLWQLSDGSILTNWVEFTSPVAFSPVEPLLALTSITGRTALVNYTNGALVRWLEGNGSTVNARQTLDFSPNGRWLGMVNNGILQIWRVSDGKLMRSYEEPSGAPVYCIDIAPNGKWFAYGNFAGEVVVARLPLLMTGVARQRGQLVLEWEGDTGLYQLQRCTNLNSGMWENVGGPTANTCVTNDLSQATVFYRVQSLPNP